MLNPSFMDKLNILRDAMQDIGSDPAAGAAATAGTGANNGGAATSPPQATPSSSQQKLEIPTKEEIDSLENNNPTKVFCVTFMHPVINVIHGKLSLECGLRSMVLTQRMPMYPLRNVKVGANVFF